jgi:hypothetical protein
MPLRRRIRSVAACLLGVMLYAQAAIAMAACDLGQREPARAVMAMEDMVCCAEHEAPESPPANANLCLAHCTSDSQRVDACNPTVAMAPPIAFLTIAPAPHEGRTVQSRIRSAAYGVAAPPLIILFQNLRI